MNKGRDVSEAYEWKPEVGYYTIEDFIALLSHEVSWLFDNKKEHQGEKKLR